MKTPRGFTLVELLFSIAILSILSMLALSLWTEIQMRMATRATIKTITDGLTLARNHAITMQSDVLVCGSSTMQTCDNNWQTGILVLRDPDRNGEPERLEDVIGFYKIPANGAHISWRGFGSSNGVSYNRMGQTSVSNGSFTYCPATRETHHARQVVINRAGRVRLSRDRNGNGIHEDSNGRDIAC